jgi:hypothetical protein
MGVIFRILGLLDGDVAIALINGPSRATFDVPCPA